jgi:copper resistance protein D
MMAFARHNTKSARIQVVLFAVTAFFLFPAAQSPLRAEDEAMHAAHAHPGASANPALDSVSQAEMLAYKNESEFNHHLAGILVLVAGLFILGEATIQDRWPLVRHIWPLCFFISGVFVLIFSDTELWPFGPQSWYFGLTHHAEVLQHKSFGILLLVLGLVELRRARGQWKSAWAGAVFPAAAIAGSVLLFFHDHQAGMHGPNHMELMHRIQSQHLSFALTGFGIALSKGLSEARSPWKSFFERLFPALLIVLGALLLVYVE